jgi:hypothetical protein
LLQSRHPFKGWVDFQKPIVVGFAGFIQQHFTDTEALVNRLE